jgi:hypothetical protein
MQNKKIQVHKFLSEVFGRETTTFDLLAIIISSVSFAVLTLFVKWNADITIIKKIILTILALDIGGGVVANFTTGTNNYYAESLRKRYLFVLFHLLQPSILIWSILIYSDKLDYCFEYKKAIQSKNSCYNPFAFELNSINSFILYRPIDTNYNAFLFFKTDFGI